MTDDRLALILLDDLLADDEGVDGIVTGVYCEPEPEPDEDYDPHESMRRWLNALAMRQEDAQ